MQFRIKFASHQINKDQIKYYFKFDNEKFLTWNDFINLLKEEGQELNKALENASLQLEGAYFWECPPVSINTLNKPFEFVVTKNKKLDNIKQNYLPFKKHIDNKKTVFASKGGNILVIPMPDEDKNFANLSSFVSNAHENWKKAFWKEVAEQLEADLADGKHRWLSTHGLGVPWLHVRIDKRPQYYSFEEYKEFKESDETTKKWPKETEKDPQRNISREDDNRKPSKNNPETPRKKQTGTINDNSNPKELKEKSKKMEQQQSSQNNNFFLLIGGSIGVALLGASLIIWWKMKQKKMSSKR